jgi:hypothetical protein
MARPILTIYISNDGVSRKKVLFGVPTLPKTSKRFIFAKRTKFGPEIGISSLKTYQLLFAQSLKLAQSAQPREENSTISTKSPKFRSRGHFVGENAPNGDFKSKHPFE